MFYMLSIKTFLSLFALKHLKNTYNNYLLVIIYLFTYVLDLAPRVNELINLLNVITDLIEIGQ